MTSRVGELDGLAGPRHRVRPPAADLDRAVGRRPLRDRAGQPGQRRLDRLARRGRARRPASARPRGRRSSTTPRSRPSRDRPCGRRGGTRRPASRGRGRPAARRPRTDRASRRDRRASSRPAGGRARRRRARSGRPAWRRRGCRRARDPATSGPRSALASAATSRRRLGEDGRSRFLERRGDDRTRRAGVSATAEPPGQDGRVDAAGLGPDADPRRLAAGLLEQDRDLGRLGLRQQVDDALRMGALGAGRGDVGVGQASTRRSGRRRQLSSRSRTTPNSRSWTSGLVR